MATGADHRVEELIEARRRLLGVLCDGVMLDVGRRPGGRLGGEIEAQIAAGPWARSTTPLESGWHAAMRHLACAGGHASVFVSLAMPEGLAATADLLVRAAFENLAIASWLLDDAVDEVERSQRALAEVSGSNRSLKALYRDQGSAVDADKADLDDRGRAILSAAELLPADNERVSGSLELAQRPSLTKLVDDYLFGVEDNGPEGGALYRVLSGSAHGNKWALERHSDSPDAEGRVGFTAAPEHSEMLMFYLGVALISVVVRCHSLLGWPDYRDRGALEFWRLGPCVVDVGG